MNIDIETISKSANDDFRFREKMLARTLAAKVMACDKDEEWNREREEWHAEQNEDRKEEAL